MIEKDNRFQVEQSGVVIPYTDRKDSVISVVRLNEPYGPGTSSVISIGSSLKSKPEAPSWKVHIPIDLVPQVSQAMLSFLKAE